MTMQKIVNAKDFGFSFNKELYFRVLEAKQYIEEMNITSNKSLNIEKTMRPDGTFSILKERKQDATEMIIPKVSSKVKTTAFPDGSVKAW